MKLTKISKTLLLCATLSTTHAFAVPTTHSMECTNKDFCVYYNLTTNQEHAKLQTHLEFTYQGQVYTADENPSVGGNTFTLALVSRDVEHNPSSNLSFVVKSINGVALENCAVMAPTVKAGVKMTINIVSNNGAYICHVVD